jgi:N6-adenosine-specific RNA methylase IME4
MGMDHERGDDGAEEGRIIDDPFTAGRRYPIVYADPPWRYRDEARAGKRGVGFKYGLLGNQDIARLPVADIAAEDAALFLWVTWPKLPEVLPVIDAWGFRYRTVAFVWVKRSLGTGGLFWGMGSWTRANTEPCLLATRGRPKRLSGGVHQVVEAAPGAHSEKPPEVRERIVRLFGDLPRIELFARQTGAGWDAWGNQAGLELPPVRRGPKPAPVASAPAPSRPGPRPRHRSDPAEEARVRRHLLAHVRAHQRITRGEAAVLCAIPLPVASAMLKGLVGEGRLRAEGWGRGRCYRLAADAPGSSRDDS